jgi:hypothetical protein
MTIKKQIKDYLLNLPESKRNDLQKLHDHILKLLPKAKLWFLDGRNEQGKVITNPNIGYGSCTMHYANGTTKEFYKIGLSGTTTGISVYVMGLEDKHYLQKTYGKKLGKVKVTGYCIAFKRLEDIDLIDFLKCIRTELKQ